MKSLVTFLFLFVSFFYALADDVVLSGKIVDEKGEPISFASIYLKNTSKGTSANFKGEFQLKIPKGNYEVVFKAIGYKQAVRSLTLNENQVLNVSLTTELLSLKEVEVNGNQEDPAYAIMRQAIRLRKKHLTEVKEFSCNSYIKGISRLKDAPKKFMGNDVQGNLKTMGLDSGKRGVIYLSESVSKFNFAHPDKIYEEMISSKVSGNNNGFSFNQATDFFLSFYQNIIVINGLSRSGFISPVAENALLSYKYRLVGSFFEGDMEVNKIAVIPRRKSDQVFKGFIYIAENSWRIHSVDLTITNATMAEVIDSLNIRQQNIPVGEDKWMPATQKYSFSGGMFKFKFNGEYVGVFSNYDINPKFNRGFFSNRVMKVNADANKKDSTYWTNARPIPLTQEEGRDYVRKDSIKKLFESPRYLDSIDRKNNKFKPLKALLFGYNYNIAQQKKNIRISSPLMDINYNTIEGWYYNPKIMYRKTFKDTSTIVTRLNMRYGFENQKVTPNASINYQFNQKNLASIGIKGGSEYADFNRNFSAIPALFNTISTLFFEQNILKLYKRDFVSLEGGREIINGVYGSADLDYSNRTPLLNTSFRKVKDVTNQEFTANNPYKMYDNNYAFSENQAFSIGAKFDITFAQSYIDRPDFKLRQGSKYPRLQLTYRKGIPEVFNSDVDYNFFSAKIYDSNKRIGILGTFRYSLGVGKFFDSSKTFYMDYKHFSGSEFALNTQTSDGFLMLSPYQFSTGNYYYEGHAEHNFGGFFLSKFPLLKKLKLEEVVGLNYLKTDLIKNYTEAYVGIQRFGFRVSYVFTNGGIENSSGLRISAGF